MAIRVFHRDEATVSMPMIASDARLVVWPGVGAHMANMNYVRMNPGEANVPHAHGESEDSIFIVSGRGTIEDFDHGLVHEFTAGDVIHVPVGVRHAVRADRGESVSSVGGPCPPDRAMLAALGVLDAIDRAK